MKIILSLLFVLSSLFVKSVYSITPVDSYIFEGDYFNTSCVSAPANINCLYGNWYLDYIGMNYIYENDYNIYPDFPVAILDTAVDLLHEDIDINLLRDISLENKILKYRYDTYYSTHGNMVTSLFSAGKIGNHVGGRGIVNANTLFLSASSISDVLNNQGQKESIGYNADSVLEGIERLVNYSSSDPDDGFTQPKIVSLSVGVSPKTEIGTKGHNFNQGAHFKATQVIRNYIEQNSGVLFVMLAHNQSTDAKKSNGALHYQYIGDPNNEQELLDENNYVLNKLSNLIIVAANGPDNILHGSSNFGESVDISGPSGVFSSACVKDNNESLYHKIDGTYGWYGYSFASIDFLNLRDASSDKEDADVFYEPCVFTGYANGNSTSQPIVAGAAAILLSKDESLLPNQLKHYLTELPNLVTTNQRYDGSYLITEFLSHSISILNIASSMVQYEIEHQPVVNTESNYTFTEITDQTVSPFTTIPTIVNTTQFTFTETTNFSDSPIFEPSLNGEITPITFNLDENLILSTSFELPLIDEITPFNFETNNPENFGLSSIFGQIPLLSLEINNPQIGDFTSNNLTTPIFNYEFISLDIIPQ